MKPPGEHCGLTLPQGSAPVFIYWWRTDKDTCQHPHSPKHTHIAQSFKTHTRRLTSGWEILYVLKNPETIWVSNDAAGKMVPAKQNPRFCSGNCNTLLFGCVLMNTVCRWEVTGLQIINFHSDAQYLKSVCHWYIYQHQTPQILNPSDSLFSHVFVSSPQFEPPPHLSSSSSSSSPAVKPIKCSQRVDCPLSCWEKYMQ